MRYLSTGNHSIAPFQSEGRHLQQPCSSSDVYLGRLQTFHQIPSTALQCCSVLTDKARRHCILQLAVALFCVIIVHLFRRGSNEL